MQMFLLIAGMAEAVEVVAEGIIMEDMEVTVAATIMGMEVITVTGGEAMGMATAIITQPIGDTKIMAVGIGIILIQIMPIPTTTITTPITFPIITTMALQIASTPITPMIVINFF
jgi:hypothetical protein